VKKAVIKGELPDIEAVECMSAGMQMTTPLTTCDLIVLSTDPSINNPVIAESIVDLKLDSLSCLTTVHAFKTTIKAKNDMSGIHRTNEIRQWYIGIARKYKGSPVLFVSENITNKPLFASDDSGIGKIRGIARSLSLVSRANDVMIEFSHAYGFDVKLIDTSQATSTKAHRLMLIQSKFKNFKELFGVKLNQDVADSVYRGVVEIDRIKLNRRMKK